jgi:adenylosuccinate lyase
MARLLRGYAQTALENVALWHERDISHSSAERVILPDACLVLDYMLVRFARLVDTLVVDADRMRENLASTRGLVSSQAVLLALVERGWSRDDAYRVVQRNALAAWEGEETLTELLTADPEVTLSAEEIAEVTSEERAIRNIGVIFERLGDLRLERTGQRAAGG